MAKAAFTSSIPGVVYRLVGFVMFIVALALVGIVIGAMIDLAVSYLGAAVAALIVVSPVALLSCLR